MDMKSPPDGVLLDRCRSGDLEAFGELVQRYQQTVFNVCFRMLGERREAEDLAQESFLRAYRKLDTFDVDRPFGPWIRRVAANVCLNHLEKRRITQVPLDEERNRITGSTLLDPEMKRIEAESQNRIRQAIIVLPPKYRAVIELRHFQSMSYEEISRTLNIPISDVKSHLFRGRRRLAENLRDG
jgi:RNA polymerase sigma-70 factor (ECF subfamily)